MLFSRLFPLVLAGFAAAAPTHRNATTRLAPDCNALVEGLSFDDCMHMSNIGMAGMGDNVYGNNGYMWIGEEGPNTLRFTNTGGVPMTLIMWDFPPNDYEASFMNVRRPKVSYSLPDFGSSVTISVGAGISGGWATLNNRQTTLSQYGQIFNTWGEFTTGTSAPGSATVNVSRLVNMGGNPQSVRVNTGCVADMDFCSYHCKNGANECGASGTYDLLRCTPDVNPNAGTGTWDGINPEGGCYGWDNGGQLTIDLGN